MLTDLTGGFSFPFLLKVGIEYRSVYFFDSYLAGLGIFVLVLWVGGGRDEKGKGGKGNRSQLHITS